MTINIGTPTPKQREFLTADTSRVAFGGSRGGGKSWAVRTKAKILGMHYHGIKMLLLRSTYAELRENHIKPLVAETAEYARYRDSDKTLTFVTGSTLKFGYCDTETDVLQYQGQEYDVIFFDEATHFTEYMYDCIKACNRGANDFPKRIYFTCNPGGKGHGWVKRLFLDRDYKQGERAEDYTFIRSSVYDNKPLLEKDPEYLTNLETLSEDLRKAWLDGDWDVFAGQYFTEWRRDRHVIEPFDIPDSWNKVIALDYGLDCLAVMWAAFDTNGDGVVYKELCHSGLAVEDAANAIKAHCTPDELTLPVWAPPDLWSRQKDTGKSIFELFYDNGIHFIRADNNRQAGWINIKSWLRPDEDDHVRLRFFQTCPEIIRCLPLLQYAPHNSMDCATEPHDITHAPDALRYLIQSRPSAAKERTPVTEESMLAEYKARRLGRHNKSKIYR
jgi:phage terminase large subunit